VRSAIVEVENTFHIIDSSYSECETISPLGELCAVWSWGRRWNPVGWYGLDVDEVTAGHAPLVAALQQLLNGMAVVFYGSMASAGIVLERICRIIESIEISVAEKREVFSHCLVRLEKGQPIGVSVARPPCTYAPGIYSRMCEASFHVPSYVPAHLVWSLYDTIFSGEEPIREDWSRRRFTDKMRKYVEPVLGVTLDIRPSVFVPDPKVVDLLIAAYLSPNSPLPGDVRRVTVVEPCTGSGVLGIAAAILGAPRVISSDIHPPSVDLARYNIRNAVLQNITVEEADGFPRGRSASMLLTNPPWSDRMQKRVREDLRRCVEDPGRRLLRRLLVDANNRRVRAAYVFFGLDDPYEPLNLRFLPLARFEHWELDRSWEDVKGLRLHRLVRA